MGDVHVHVYVAGVWLYRVAAAQGVDARGIRAHDAESIAASDQTHSQRVDHVDTGAVTTGDETDTKAGGGAEKGTKERNMYMCSRSGMCASIGQ
jgi:hypothetical protein